MSADAEIHDWVCGGVAHYQFECVYMWGRAREIRINKRSKRERETETLKKCCVNQASSEEGENQKDRSSSVWIWRDAQVSSERTESPAVSSWTFCQRWLPQCSPPRSAFWGRALLFRPLTRGSTWGRQHLRMWLWWDWVREEKAFEMEEKTLFLLIMQEKGFHTKLDTCKLIRGFSTSVMDALFMLCFYVSDIGSLSLMPGPRNVYLTTGLIRFLEKKRKKTGPDGLYLKLLHLWE